MTLGMEQFVKLYIKAARRRFELDQNLLAQQRIVEVAEKLSLRREEVRKLWNEVPDLPFEGEERIHTS
jgi:hypothetical protein